MRCVPTLLLSLAILSPLAAEDSSTGPLIGAGKPDSQTPSGESRTIHSWDMPAITVEGQTSSVREAQRIGCYGQPRWSARRLFTETRTYVVPAGQIEFEYWLTMQGRTRGDADGVGKTVQQYEVEMGLPHRFQVDLYQKYVKKANDGAMELDATKAELRWAFADWDVIPGNPTAYIEWAMANGDYDAVEGKLLFCDEFTDQLRWGLNLVWEEKTGGDRERSQEITGGISYGVIDSVFAVGAEAKAAFINTIDKGGTDARTPYDNEILVGPAAQWRPAPQMHIDATVLVGTTSDSPQTITTFIAGWEF